ncbi:MAG: GyrI-like domain-containing protein [Bacteroidota bacterium]|nr:GyrI-like domain-containing protein [Bacteroidota bacterium]
MENHKSETQRIYLERINKVVSYINANLDENFDLEELAKRSNYSSFHFHRIMRGYLGEPLWCYITRVRLDTAAHLLRMTELPVNEIAQKVGYDIPSSFNKAFRKRFEVSPLQFRENRTSEFIIDIAHRNTRIMENLTLQPCIKELKDVQVIYTTAIGVYGDENTSRAWEQICTYAKEKRLFGFGTEFIGIGHDNPSITEPEKCRYDACITVKKVIEPEGNIGVKMIQGGKYAIFKLKGPYTLLADAYDYIFGKWVSENGIELGERPPFEKYLNSPDDTKPEKLETEIYVPIK